MALQLDIPAWTVLRRCEAYRYQCRIDGINFLRDIFVDEMGQKICIGEDIIDAPFIGDTVALVVTVKARNYMLGYFKNEGHILWMRTIYPIIVD